MKIYCSRYNDRFELLDRYVGKDAWIKFHDLIYTTEYAWYRPVEPRDDHNDYVGNCIDNIHVDLTTGKYTCTRTEFKNITERLCYVLSYAEQVVIPLEIRTTDELFNIIDPE